VTDIRFSILVTPDGKRYWAIPAETAELAFSAVPARDEEADLLASSEPQTASQEALQPIMRASEPSVSLENETIGQRIRRLRISRGLSQRALGVAAQKVTQAEICRIEKGRVQPEETTISKLLKVLEP
jgi:ribosome-binding protein aMBF1 (putative translation factor)